MALTGRGDTLAHGSSHNHLFQLYAEDSRLLEKNVGDFLWQSLKQNGAALVVATPAHRASFCDEISRLGADAAQAQRQGHLILLDADDLLGRILVDGYPNASAFAAHVGTVVREILARLGVTALHVYGEMVGILWQARQYAAAVALEQLWNELRETLPFELFCSYPIDIFDKEFECGIVGALLGTHTHLLPTGLNERLESALDRALEEVLDSRMAGIKPHLQMNGHAVRPCLPRGEATILWLRRHYPDRASAILTRARHYYEAIP